MGSDEAIDTQNNDGSNEIKEEIYVIELNVCVTEVKKRQSSVVKATGTLILRNKKYSNNQPNNSSTLYHKEL